MKENQLRRDQISDLQCQLFQKNKEVNDLNKYASCLKAELGLVQPKMEKYEREAEIYAQQ